LYALVSSFSRSLLAPGFVMSAERSSENVDAELPKSLSHAGTDAFAAGVGAVPAAGAGVADRAPEHPATPRTIATRPNRTAA
jgi:hypothetical protein